MQWTRIACHRVPPGCPTGLIRLRSKRQSSSLNPRRKPVVEAPPKPQVQSSVAPVCRCGSLVYRDSVIHDGQTVRRDCARCRKFVSFVVWYGAPASDGGAVRWLTFQFISPTHRKTPRPSYSASAGTTIYGLMDAGQTAVLPDRNCPSSGSRRPGSVQGGLPSWSGTT